MLKNPYYLTFVLLVWLIASLVLRISYNYPNTLYNWLLASLIIRLIVRAIHATYQKNGKTSRITDWVVELFMLLISFGVIISIFSTKDFLWSDQLIFLLAELYLLIGVCVNLIKIRKKGCS
ncbi:hypothetical protein A7311_25060 [Paenibacillus polymyxa]|jgi:hypothetical protein|nr:uncharacterized membrane protein YoaK (UPF0700 family) [Paenibacillus sp. 1182]ODB50722.1 hypothetical protein A7311_25060 [Paenibacillus polymyxa]